jgi:hypothetical protein
MTAINDAAAAARETARTSAGQFGTQEHSAPEATLVLAEPDLRTSALTNIERALADDTEALEHARQHIEDSAGDTWRPSLHYVQYDDQLTTEQLDAYLRGDEEPLDEIIERFEDDDSYADRVDEAVEEIFGRRADEFDDDVAYELRELVREWDDSTLVSDLAAHNRTALIQLPAAADDDAFGQALEDASRSISSATCATHGGKWGDEVVCPTCTTAMGEAYTLTDGNPDALCDRHGGTWGDDPTCHDCTDSDGNAQDPMGPTAAMEKLFQKTLSDAGVPWNEQNAAAIRELIAETSLDAEYQAAEQWRLRLLTYTDPNELALSSYSTHGDTPRTVTVNGPHLLLQDPWNGRGHTVQLTGEYTIGVDEDRPARLDDQLGYGSFDKVAGVHKPAFAAHVDVVADDRP